ncbi:hypothetical protein MMPV_010061 [Pyropia vietnamensis]
MDPPPSSADALPPSTDGAKPLTPDGQVTKRVLTPGTGDSAGRASRVWVHYTLWAPLPPPDGVTIPAADTGANSAAGPSGAANTALIATATAATTGATPSVSSTPLGLVEDSATRRRCRGAPYSFRIGTGAVLPGLEVLVGSMCPGEVAVADLRGPYAGARLGRGASGGGGGVRVRVALVRVVGDVRSKGVLGLSPVDRVKAAGLFKEEGNGLFKDGKYGEAAEAYERCLQYLQYVNYGARKEGVAAEAEETDGEVAKAGATDGGAAGGEAAEGEAVEKEAAGGEATAEETAEGETADGKAAGREEKVATPSVEATVEGAADGDTAVDGDAAANGDAVAEEDASADGEAETAADAATDGAAASEGASAGAGATGDADAATTDDADAAGAKPPPPPPAPVPAADIDALRLTALTNLSLCLSKAGDAPGSIRAATAALAIDGTHAKALYYRGRSRAATKDWAGARADLAMAAAAMPRNMGLRVELARVERALEGWKAKEKKAFGAMFA